MRVGIAEDSGLEQRWLRRQRPAICSLLGLAHLNGVDPEESHEFLAHRARSSPNAFGDPKFRKDRALSKLELVCTRR
jgi:hypothetical protein